MNVKVGKLLLTVCRGNLEMSNIQDWVIFFLPGRGFEPATFRLRSRASNRSATEVVKHILNLLICLFSNNKSCICKPYCDRQTNSGWCKKYHFFPNVITARGTSNFRVPDAGDRDNIMSVGGVGGITHMAYTYANQFLMSRCW